MEYPATFKRKKKEKYKVMFEALGDQPFDLAENGILVSTLFIQA